MKLLSLLAVFVLGGGASLHAATTYICFGVPVGDEYVPQAGDNMVRINLNIGVNDTKIGEFSQTIPKEDLNNGVITSVTANSIGTSNVIKVPPPGASGVGEIALFKDMEIDSKVYNNLIQGNNTATDNFTQTSTTMTLALGGFAANTTYTITLLSARVAGNDWSPSANFSLTGINTTVSLESLGAGGTPTADGVTGLDTSRGKAAAITWTFTTGATDLDNLLLTAEGKWSMNALVINSTPVSVPEPSAAALGLFGLAGLMLRRKRN